MTDVEKSGNLEVLSSISIELDALRLGPLNSTRVCKITLRTEFTRYLESSTNYIQTRWTKFLQNGKRKIISSIYSRNTKSLNERDNETSAFYCSQKMYRRINEKFNRNRRTNISEKIRPRDFPISCFFEKYLNLRLMWGNRSGCQIACAAYNPIYRSEIGWGDLAPRINTFSSCPYENSWFGEFLQGEIRKHPWCRSI